MKAAGLLCLVMGPMLVVVGCNSDARLENENADVLVAKLGDPDGEVRAAAAASLRRLLATDPKARTNDHGKHYWQQRAAQVEAGMKREAVLKLLPPMTPAPSPDLWPGAGMSSGFSGVARWRLDHYWVVTVNYRRPDIVTEIVRVEEKAMSIWVEPPKDFSGRWTTWHVNGQKAHEVEYEDGKYHGCLTSYHDNGRRLFRQHYVSGVCSGPDTGWYRNGSKSYEGQYVNGKREGTWTHWYESGRLRNRTQLRMGEEDGLRESWFPDGQKQYEVRYRNGKRHGPDRAWDETGKLLWSRQYEDGERTDRREP